MLHLLLLGHGGGGEVLLDLDIRLPPVLLGELCDGRLLASLQGSGRWEGSAWIFPIFLTFSFFSGVVCGLVDVLHLVPDISQTYTRDIPEIYRVSQTKGGLVNVTVFALLHS